jgi:hypothetical protein
MTIYDNEEIKLVRGHQRNITFLPKLDKDSKLLSKEEIKNCNNGSHYFYVDKITDCDPWLIIIVKWKCLFCGHEVKKEVSPVD